MIVTEDLILVKKIFELVEEGIVEGYDAFRYEVEEVGRGYIMDVLTVERNGVEVTNAKTDFNGAFLYGYVAGLKENSVRRGESWASFVMSYRRGGDVKTKFNY